MSRVHVLAEGQAEETFIRELVGPHLATRGVYTTAILVKTKHTKAGRSFKGGLSRYEPVRRDVIALLRDTDIRVLTTMIDYYHLPADFPGADMAIGGAAACAERARHIERQWSLAIGDRRFKPYLSLHEYEALLFADPGQIAALAPASRRETIADALRAVCNEFESIEAINDGAATAPAKRIAALIPDYRKPLGGVLVAQAIGLPAMRAASPRFDDWMAMLEGLAP